MDEINVETLFVETVKARPFHVDWQEAGFPENEYDRYAEAFEFEGDERRPTLIADENGVTHLASPLGNAFSLDDWDGYIEAQTFFQEAGEVDEDNLPEGIFSREDFWAFQQVKPRYSGAEGPQMNHLWPCPLDEDGLVDAAAQVAGLPVCVVVWDGETGLALTGGGTDLSWEMAEAYMRLGFLPPVHLNPLPGLAGKEREASTPLVLAGMRRSLSWLRDWSGWELDRLNERWGSL